MNSWKWSVKQLNDFYISDGLQIRDYPDPPEEFVTFIKTILRTDIKEGKGVPFFTVYGNVPYKYAWNINTDTVEKIRNPVKVLTDDEILKRVKEFYHMAKECGFQLPMTNPFDKDASVMNCDMALFEEFYEYEKECEKECEKNEKEDEEDNDNEKNKEKDLRWEEIVNEFKNLVIKDDEHLEDERGSEYGGYVDNDDGFLPKLENDPMADGAYLDEFGNGPNYSLERFYWRLMHYYYSGDNEAKGYIDENFCYF